MKTKVHVRRYPLDDRYSREFHACEFNVKFTYLEFIKVLSAVHNAKFVVF